MIGAYFGFLMMCGSEFSGFDQKGLEFHFLCSADIVDQVIAYHGNLWAALQSLCG